MAVIAEWRGWDVGRALLCFLGPSLSGWRKAARPGPFTYGPIPDVCGLNQIEF